MKQEWIEATYEWVDEFTNQEVYKRYQVLSNQIDSDKDIQALILVFQTSQKNYQECLKYGDYHPDLPRYQRQFQQHKEQLYTHPVIQELKQLEKDIQSQLDHVSKQIATSISAKIKHPNAIGLIQKHR